jgi:hypothetical protein
VFDGNQLEQSLPAGETFRTVVEHLNLFPVLPPQNERRAQRLEHAQRSVVGGTAAEADCHLRSTGTLHGVPNHLSDAEGSRPKWVPLVHGYVFDACRGSHFDERVARLSVQRVDGVRQRVLERSDDARHGNHLQGRARGHERIEEACAAVRHGHCVELPVNLRGSGRQPVNDGLVHALCLARTLEVVAAHDGAQAATWGHCGLRAAR